ncbi:MAG: hypothetical protein U0235_25000 [Polyangiaceae bacterium]
MPRPGMYVVDAPGIYEAYLAFPVANDARDAAAWLAEALSEGGGLLATSVVGAGLARSATARVVGGPFAQALVIHVAATEASLDGAVAQVRALLERVRKGAVTDADWSKIAAARDANGSRCPRPAERTPRSSPTRARPATFRPRAPGSLRSPNASFARTRRRSSRCGHLVRDRPRERDRAYVRRRKR